MHHTHDEIVCDIEHAVSHLLRSAVSMRLHERIAAETGVALERSSFWVLGRLADRGPLRLSELAQLMGLDPSTVSRQVQQLERQELVEREADPTDARAVRLAPSAAGRVILEKVRAARREHLQHILARWPVGDRKDLARLLTRLADDLTTPSQEA